MGDEAALAWCRDIVSRVNALEPAMQALEDGELVGLTTSYRARLGEGETLDELLPEAFATLREAAQRAIGQRLYDVQILGGAALHLGTVVEMRTGEGKTLTAALPAYLTAVSGTGVHVFTSNAYLATRDHSRLSPVFHALGLSSGVLDEHSDKDGAGRRQVYACDVSYGSYQQFAFDFLRDGIAWESSELVERGRPSAIIDEADLVMLDEVNVPMMISGPAQTSEDRYAPAAELAARLVRERDYEVDERARAASLTDQGAVTAENFFGVQSLYDEDNQPLSHLISAAVRAKELYVRDRDYIVGDGQVHPIDTTTGRVNEGRTFDSGIHQALCIKEGLEVVPERQVLTRIVTWDYLRGYQKVCGLTGTASSDAESFKQLYDLDVVVIPTNRPMIRQDHPDALYTTAIAKMDGLIEKISARHETQQPILVGTTSIEQAEALSVGLNARGITHEVLTARDTAREAEILADAGRLGAVTVVSQLAGRGVDIRLGGADERDRDQVADLGGLLVFGAERISARRPEEHLRGRAGRQGDPGETRFLMSLEDELPRALAKGVAAKMMRTTLPEGGDCQKLCVSGVA